MKGSEILQFIKQSWPVQNTFRGVFPSDRLPTHLPSGIRHAFICNLDKAHKRGTHWVAIFISTFGDITYFDSFGRPPYVKGILDFIRQHGRRLEYNKVPIQGALTRTCGLYCIYFVEQMCIGSSLKRFLHEFQTLNPAFNDNRIVQLFLHRRPS